MPVYISIPSTVDARFADAPETVRTLEGDVRASACVLCPSFYCAYIGNPNWRGRLEAKAREAVNRWLQGEGSGVNVLRFPVGVDQRTKQDMSRI